jgi:hypothetical protein
MQEAARVHGVFTARNDAQERPQINITPAERIGRMVLGGAAAIAGVLLLAASRAYYG